MSKRIREYGICIGEGTPGPRNKITDVAGVRVGHTTIKNKDHNTGVTVILPSLDNPFTGKLTAAAYVHNGFGKSQGLVQIQELGTLETPIALTNTLNVGLVHDALVGYMIERCREDGVELTSVNPVVGECNDASLNRICERVVGAREVEKAIDSAGEDFLEGAVGAGAGTTCFGCKGGIGSSSREIVIGDQTYILGVLVQSNFGKTRDLCLNGEHIGPAVAERIEESKLDEGSIMMVVATDLPVSSRQLGRILRRAGAGLSRIGSYMGHGSGDIVIGFTTANRQKNQTRGSLRSASFLLEEDLESAFRAASDATEEAILNSLSMAETTYYQGKVRYSLEDIYLKEHYPYQYT